MSGFQPIGAELLYSSYALGTTTTPTAGAVSLIGGYPPIVVAPGYFKNVGSWSSSLKLLMGGLMTTTATIPSFQFNLYANVATTSAPAFSASGVTLTSSAATAPTTAVANVPWYLWLDIGLRAIALGAASTIVSWGVWSCTSLNAAGEFTLPASGAYVPPATWDTSQGYVLWPGLTLGAATAGNTMTTEFVKLYGEN